MAVDLEQMKAHLNVTDDADNALITTQIAAAEKHIARLLGFALDDEDEFPDGTPEDVEQAVMMLAAHWYENREATLVGVTAQTVPMGVLDIVAERRTYTFGLADDE